MILVFVEQCKENDDPVVIGDVGSIVIVAFVKRAKQKRYDVTDDKSCYSKLRH